MVTLCIWEKENHHFQQPINFLSFQIFPLFLLSPEKEREPLNKQSPCLFEKLYHP